MTTQVYDAVFTNGAFRPLRPVAAAIAEGQQVRLVVELEDKPDVLNLAAEVYAGLSDEEVEEVEQVALDRHEFFSRAA